MHLPTERDWYIPRCVQSVWAGVFFQLDRVLLAQVSKSVKDLLETVFDVLHTGVGGVNFLEELQRRDCRESTKVGVGLNPTSDTMWCGSLQPNMSVDVDIHRLSIDSA